MILKKIDTCKEWLTINNLLRKIFIDQFSEIEEKFSNAEVLLAQAQKIATEKDLTLLKKQVSEETKKIEMNFKKMKKLIANNATLNDKIEESELMNYIKNAQNIINLK
ncbi:MAG: hypothetical protein ACW967_10900 [Candidatus Hodarchaeales archaeon]